MNQQETEIDRVERIPLGDTAAALLSSALGCLTVSTTYRAITQSQVLAGKTTAGVESWPPYPSIVGSYPIHQIVGFSVWLGSWAVLYLVLRRRDLPLKPTIAAFFILLFLATAIAWRPIGNPLGSAIAQVFLR